MAGVRAAPASNIVRTGEFAGLNNVADPIDIGITSQVKADNVYVTKNGTLRRVKGWVKRVDFANPTGAYATRDLTRMYVIDSGTLYKINDDLTTQSLVTGLSDGPFDFGEVNGVVFFTDGVSYGSIGPGGYRPWGIPNPNGFDATAIGSGALRTGTYQLVATFTDVHGLESSNSPVSNVDVLDGQRIAFLPPTASGYTTNVYIATPDDPTFYLWRADVSGSQVFNGEPGGDELPFWNMNPPRGVLPTYFQGQLYTAEYLPTDDITVVWRSLPLQFHHFDPGAEGIALPGRVMQMCASRETHFSGNERLAQRGVADFMVMGTDREIYSWDNDQLVQLASYGTVAGRSFTEFKGKVYMWTKRGLCSGLPFENLTEKRVSVAPGTQAAAAVIEQDGTRRYVVALHKGGTAFNPHG